MTEAEFWSRFYLIVCWRDAFPELLGQYDWITPNKYVLGKNTTIHGKIGLIGGLFSECDFEFRLLRSYNSVEEIDWQSCLPPSMELDSKVPQSTSAQTDWMYLESGTVIIEAPAVKVDP